MGRTSVILLSSLSVLFVLIPAQSADIIPECESGKEYKGGNPCQLSCKYLHEACTEELINGCYCKDGTVDDGTGKCVKMEECCKGNTKYTSCGNECTQSCAKYINPKTMCILSCNSMCKCKEGYWMLKDTKECVLPEKCPKSG